MSIANKGTSCDECGLWFEIDDMVHEDGLSLCEDCAAKRN